MLIEPIRETPFARFFFRDPNGYVFEVVEEEPRRAQADQFDCGQLVYSRPTPSASATRLM